MKKEMSRKEFLGMIGLGVISMIGISSMLKNLGDTFTKQTGSTNSSLDYGDNMYGGLQDGINKAKNLL